MKRKLSSPILELSFAAGIMIILSLPLFVNAQDHKEFKVNINNSDTIVNGKNIKDLSATDRKDALKKLNELNEHITITMKNDGGGDILTNGIVLKRKNGNNAAVTIERNGSVYTTTPMANAYSLTVDSAGAYSMSSGNNVAVMANGAIRNSIAPRIVYGTRSRSFSDDLEPSRNGAVYAYANSGNRKNTQNFTYSNTDKDGISTHVRYSVSDGRIYRYDNDAGTKKASGEEKADLTLQDLTLVPSFSTGKTTLSFSLADKAAASVQFKDSEGTVLWEGKTTGSEFSKSFALPKNGNYYLEVKQGSKQALRKISKEE